MFLIVYLFLSFILIIYTIAFSVVDNSYYNYSGHLSSDGYLTEDWIPMTQEEAKAYYTPFEICTLIKSNDCNIPALFGSDNIVSGIAIQGCQNNYAIFFVTKRRSHGLNLNTFLI